MTFFKPKILLASQSPRRFQIFKDSDFLFEQVHIQVEEDFDIILKKEEIPLYLCQKKAEAYSQSIPENSILVTADTIVWCNNQVLNKPQNKLEARQILEILSNNNHVVYTAFCIKNNQKTVVDFDETKVYFNPLSNEMIDYYIENYHPFDKAGSYGVQDFIGLIGIKKIEGCFYNVMGFPMSKFLKVLSKEFEI